MAVAMTCFGQTAAHAASFEVTNLDDAGVGSLREAIAAANGAPGADVITFAPGLSGMITLTTGQLAISDSLQIVGPGRAALTVDGNAAGRVFDIPLSPGDVVVSISGLTVSNGKDATGGGIRVQDESLSLDDVALIGNTALGNGGGLHADGFAMTLNVRNSTISGNAASGGGGAYIEDTKGVAFDGVVIDGNTASRNGGGIFFYDPDGDVDIANATITNNVAQKGGGIYLYSQDVGTFSISKSSISGNAAATGGGVYLYDIDHPVSISDTTISDNAATNGAGLNIDRISAPAVISNSTISGNTAAGAGGGVRLARGGGLTINHSTITANSAANAGGARFPGPVTLSHVIVAGNTALTTADLHAAGGVTADFSIIGAMIGAVTDGGGNHFDVTDPMLAPLGDNGGPTQTHRPLAASPIIDTGNPAVATPATDQRGMPRIVGTIDIGAVEAQSSIVEFDSTAVTVAENAGALAVTVTRTGVADLPATVEVATTDGTAIAPGDYGTLSTQLSWAAGETGPKTVNIPLVLDAAHEADEAFSVALAGPTGATLGAYEALTVALSNSNTAPTISPIADLSTQSGTTVPTIAAQVGDAEQPTSALIVTATSSDQAVIADGGIAIGGSDAQRMLDITPLAVGVASITVTVSDGSLTTTETFTVTVTAPPVPTAGLIPDPYTPGKTALLVTGTSGIEHVSLKAVDNGRIQVTINGRIIGSYAPTGTIIVHTDAGADRIVVRSDIKLAQLLFGGDGNDSIHSAEGRAVVIGGQGDDRLYGYRGRDIIIGGAGIDVLSGRDNEDILIAGPSAYDVPTTATMASLSAIHAEWARSDASHATRVARISGAAAGGLNEVNSLQAGITVTDDTHKDTLQGDGGTDWYIANLVPPGSTLDAIRDRAKSETRTEL